MLIAVFTIYISVFTFVYIFHPLIVIFRGASIVQPISLFSVVLTLSFPIEVPVNEKRKPTCFHFE